MLSRVLKPKLFKSIATLKFIRTTPIALSNYYYSRRQVFVATTCSPLVRFYNTTEQEEPEFVKCTIIRMRGAPFRATQRDVANFFEGLPITGMAAVTHRGFHTEFFISFESEKAANDALKKNKQYMGHRYVDLSPSNETELETVRKVFKNINNVVKMRGIDFEACTEENIIKFFEGIAVESLYVPRRGDGKPIGDAYVSFSNEEETKRAMNNNKKYIGSRFVILERSKENGLCFLRGFPYDVDTQQVRAFLSGYNVLSVRLRRFDGRPTGDAFVMFNTEEEKLRAMEELNKANFKGRYIEFLEPTMRQ